MAVASIGHPWAPLYTHSPASNASANSRMKIKGLLNWRMNRRQTGSGGCSGSALGPTCAARASASLVESPIGEVVAKSGAICLFALAMVPVNRRADDVPSPQTERSDRPRFT